MMRYELVPVLKKVIQANLDPPNLAYFNQLIENVQS